MLEGSDADEVSRLTRQLADVVEEELTVRPHDA
jgi:hypothetical protein